MMMHPTMVMVKIRMPWDNMIYRMVVLLRSSTKRRMLYTL
jgi:hypothetical protein